MVIHTRAGLWRAGLLAAIACFAGARSTRASPSLPEPQTPAAAAVSTAAPGDHPIVLRVGRLFTMNASDQVFTPGMLIVQGGKVRYAGAPTEVPADAETIEFAHGWACPGMVDLHTHIHTGGGFGDINDMVQAVNPELRASPSIVPSNRLVRRACASGVTTLFGIPGSGTNMGGFGVLYKTKTDASYEQIVLADPGGMKIAQDSNPQRDAGDFGAGRAAMGWILEDVNRRALAALAQGRSDPALTNLMKVHAKELPVLIHTAGSESVVNTSRMWRVTFDTRSVLSHGCFDSWRSAEAVAAMGMPVNCGPRTIDWFSSRNGQINCQSAIYSSLPVPLFSLNTDSPVIPEEELFLQGAVSARYGADSYTMLRALTIHPAQAFGIDGRVGSLEVGKDADVVIRTGDPLDPRSAVEIVLIDGQVQYDRERDGMWF